MVGMEGREEEEKEEEKMSTGVKIETNEIDGWTEKEATETKNQGGTRRRRRRTRKKQEDTRRVRSSSLASSQDFPPLRFNSAVEGNAIPSTVVECVNGWTRGSELVGGRQKRERWQQPRGE